MRDFICDYNFFQIFLIAKVFDAIVLFLDQHQMVPKYRVFKSNRKWIHVFKTHVHISIFPWFPLTGIQRAPQKLMASVCSSITSTDSVVMAPFTVLSVWDEFCRRGSVSPLSWLPFESNTLA